MQHTIQTITIPIPKDGSIIDIKKTYFKLLIIYLRINCLENTICITTFKNINGLQIQSKKL